MAHSITDLSEEALQLLSEYHLGTLTTMRRDGTPHVVAVGFTVDPESGVARVITSRFSQKAVNAARGGRAVVANVDGRRWLSLEGRAELWTDADAVAEGERWYARRYRVPRPNPRRAVVAIRVDRVLGSRAMFSQDDKDWS